MLAVPWSRDTRRNPNPARKQSQPYMYALPPKAAQTMVRQYSQDQRYGQPSRQESGVARVLAHEANKPKVADRWQSEYRFQYMSVKPKPPYSGYDPVNGATPLDPAGVKAAVDAVYHPENIPMSQQPQKLHAPAASSLQHPMAQQSMDQVHPVLQGQAQSQEKMPQPQQQTSHPQQQMSQLQQQQLPCLLYTSPSPRDS
eukprot:TRINITY_DN4548_c0_g1_i9.p1 TRINITY_DN4548_c0_g1~~TRINITY_DN4548_c0_g1_i9.p1  ORF type:complete len:199 (-),score=27.61 TRINITY_DN4548_c0_g1_i9:152-748(-)